MAEKKTEIKRRTKVDKIKRLLYAYIIRIYKLDSLFYFIFFNFYRFILNMLIKTTSIDDFNIKYTHKESEIQKFNNFSTQKLKSATNANANKFTRLSTFMTIYNDRLFFN